MRKLGNIAKLYFICLVLSFTTLAYAETIYVYPGESIQDAIDLQAVSGDTVFVYSGTYDEDISMKDGVDVAGEAYEEVVVNGSVLFQDATCTLKYVTILFLEGTFLSYNNTHYTELKLLQDAGITAINSSPTIENCVIKPDLEAINSLHPETPDLEHYGKAIQIWNMYQNPEVAPQVEGNLIQDTNCGIYYFSQSFGGLITGRIKNNTLYDNKFGIVLRMHNENPEIVNNIITNGTYAGIFLAYRDDPLFDNRKSNIHHNALWDNLHNYWLDSDGAEFDLTEIAGNISDDPLFLDAPGGDFNLDALSPCIDTGENGEDMGAYPTIPGITLNSIYDGKVVNEDPLTVEGSYSGSTPLTIVVNGIVAVLSDERFTAEGIDLTEGDNTITITATDSSGNETTVTINVYYQTQTAQESNAHLFLYEMMDKYYKKEITFKIKAQSTNCPYGTYGVDISDYATLTDVWQEVDIPLQEFIDQDIDITQLTAFSLTFDNPQAGGTIYIDDIKLKEPSPSAVELLIDDFEDGIATSNSLDYWTNDGGSCVYNGDINGARKVEWDSVNDYWYTVVYDGNNPLDGSSYDRLSFKVKQASWNELRLIENYAPTDTIPSIYTASIKETALAIITLIARGTSEDIERAHILSDALRYCQENDPTFTDGRLRDTYWSTALTSESGTESSVKSPDSTCGNLAWVLLAWLQDYKIDPVAHADILNAAINLAIFIDIEYKDSTNPGFVAGYTGWEPSQVKQTYKATESNAVLYVAFKQLYDLSLNNIWYDDAIWIKRYLEEIAWNDSDKMFFSGTKDDAITINTYNPTIDANTISLLALGADYPLTQVDEWIETGYSNTSDTFSGYDYNLDKDGVVFVSTAQTGLLYSLLGNITQRDTILAELRRAQVEAQNNNGKGIVAASHDGVSSGWGYTYDAVLNVGTTSWYIALERGFNPLWSRSINYVTPHSEGVIKGVVTLEGRTDYMTQATFLVTEPGQADPLPSYTPINDEDKEKDGIQITLDSQGNYKLTDLPTGIYDISVKANGYLRETAANIVLVQGAYIEGLDFGPLPAGDANNDNSVDAKDSTIVDDAMGSTPGSPDWDEKADINNDDVIDSLDSGLVSANLGTIGDMGKDIPGPIITIDSPVKGALAMKSPIDVTVTGSIDDDTAAVTVNGVPAAIESDAYTATVTLSAAADTILVSAEDSQSNITELESYISFGITTPVLILEDFEDDINRVGEWWDENGSIVYTRHIQKDLGCDGERSLKVEYHKYPGYENSSFGIQPDQDGITNDFTPFDQLQLRINTNDPSLEIKIILEDEDGGKWSQTKTSTVQGNWEQFIYDFSNSKLINFGKVKNIIFIVNPGDDASQGTFNIDSLQLISTKSCISLTPQTPSLSSLTSPPFYDSYTLEWTDTSALGGVLYELWEDDNDTFDTPAIYWLSDLSINFEEKVNPTASYYKVRSWNTAPSQGGMSSSFSSTCDIIIVDNPPEIERVDSFTSSGDNDNQYERGILVNINVVEAHEAPDIVAGTVRITSAATAYDSGVLPLSQSEDGTYWTYRWDTIGCEPTNDYVIETTLEDAGGQVDSGGSNPGDDLVITLTETTAPLLSKLVENTDLSYPGRGMTVKITRVYDHILQDEEPFGAGWTHSYVMRLKEYPDGTVDFVMGDGKETMFIPAGGGTYTNKPGIHDELTKNPDGTYKIRKKNGTILNFDTSGKLLTIVDTNGNTISLAYYPDGRLHTITNASSGVYTFVYKTWTAILETETRTYTRLDYIQDPAERKVTYGYDELYGYLTSVKDPLLNTTTYTYTADTHKLQSILYPEGGHKFFTYYDDDYGRLQSEYKDGNEEKRTYVYSTTEPKLTIQDYYGKEAIIYFNEHGRTTSITDACEKTTYYTWDDDLNRTGIKDPENNETTFTYDGMGNLLTVTRKKDGIFYTTTYTYHPVYNKVETITDAKSRLTTVLDYDPANGNLQTITNIIPDEPDYVTTFDYYGNGQLERKTDAKSNITEYTYYDNGLLKEEKRYKDPVTIYTTLYTYDDYGNPHIVTDAEGKVTTYTYNGLNQLRQVEDANHDFTHYTYDGNGNLKTIKDAKNHTTTYYYDLLDRLDYIVYEDSEMIDYTYDKMSNLETKTDQNGNTTTYSYDDVYRLQTKIYQDASSVTYAYYDDGTLKDVTDSNGTIHYDYNEWNELEQVTYPGAAVVSYGYDELGNRTSITYPSGKVVSYTYDIMNRMETVTLEGATPKVSTYTWNEVSQRDLLELPNGSEVDYIYDTLNRLEDLTNTTSTASTIANFTYTLDKVGNRETMTDSEGLHQYSYDPTYQLTDVDYPVRDDQNYVYDPAGNRDTVTEGVDTTSYTPDNMNRYTAVDGSTYGYNSNGCLTSKTDASGTTAYEYDYENRLTHVIASGSEAIYTYDYLGRRIKKDVDGTITKYIYNGNRVITETDELGNVICEYVYGNNIDEVLFMVRGGSFYYYHYDGLGSVRAITDLSENTIETYTYDVYGRPTIYDATYTEIPESQFGNSYYFTGRRFDKESGLYYYRNRYYNCELGRFISPDPLGPADGPNLYRYVWNNPLKFVDPFGLYTGKKRPDETWDEYWERKRKGWDDYWERKRKQLEDMFIPPAEAAGLRDPDDIMEELDRKEREGEPWEWGDELDPEKVQKAAEDVDRLGKEILKAILSAWKKWFGL